MRGYIYYPPRTPVVAFPATGHASGLRHVARIRHSNLLKNLYKCVFIFLCRYDSVRTKIARELSEELLSIESAIESIVCIDEVISEPVFLLSRSKLDKKIIIFQSNGQSLLCKVALDERSVLLVRNEARALQRLEVSRFNFSHPDFVSEGEIANGYYVIQSVVGGESVLPPQEEQVIEIISELTNGRRDVKISHLVDLQEFISNYQLNDVISDVSSLIDEIDTVLISSATEHGDLTENNFVGNSLVDWEYFDSCGSSFFDLISYLLNIGIPYGELPQYLSDNNRYQAYIRRCINGNQDIVRTIQLVTLVQFARTCIRKELAVSYTHLTLPTKA